MEYNSFRVAFGKTETKNRTDGSVSYVNSSIEEVPKRKKVGAYHPQSYDVIRGQELVKRKYIDQSGIMESIVIPRNKY